MLAKKQKMGVVVLAVVTASLLAPACFSAEEQPVQTQGIVSVIRDANDVIKEVHLNAEAEIYNVVLDEKGLELGEWDGLKVDVNGIVTMEKDQMLLKVIDFAGVGEE
ncbi:MAG: hypothetical protein JW947_09630 [Sedimentisphaerales bacterium]|nr:hypothetical protein [Sedimentisphaerales bacterium]